MIGQAVPLFKAGNLLTKEMLSSLKDYSFGLGELLLYGYANGLLSGCKITTTESTMQLNKGIIVFDGKLYLIQKPLIEEYHPTDVDTVFKLRIKDEVKTQSFIYREIETVLTDNTGEKRDEIELCRFKLQKGFKLRTIYKDFYDRITPYDTVNVVHAPYSAYGESSISPDITADFADYLTEGGSDNILDQVFCMQAYQSGGMAMNRKMVVQYLSSRLGIEKKEYSNLEIFRYLEDILREAVRSGGGKHQKKTHGRRVLLD